MNQPYAPILAETVMSLEGSAKNKYANVGWTKRDEFAAQAPVDIPDWFQVKPPEGNVVPIGSNAEMERFFMWRYFYADQMLEFNRG